jgi:altronate dehydratase
MMQNSVLKIGPKDNVSIALTDLHKGERITYSDHVYILTSDVPAKHMFGTQDLSAGDDVVMYGVLVGKARHPIQAGSGFDMNPSPGNIRDRLVTDAAKSGGAARRGGCSPVTAVLDYPEYSAAPGLNFLCTTGTNVECVAAQLRAGANPMYTTGLGTPTGNPIAPVLEISTNSPLAQRMQDIIDIDIDTGAVISGGSTIEEMGDALLERLVEVAIGQLRTKAELLRAG